jgi:Domain of unknown function (DUF4136)
MNTFVLRTRPGPRWIFQILVVGVAICGSAQKVKVGYDKSADFSKYQTYTWAKPQMLATRPLLYDYVVNSIDSQLEAKGFRKAERDGDLTLIPAGGIEYGSNLPAGTPILPVYGGPPPDINATMWTGGNASSVSSGPMVAEGSLTLEFVDRIQNKVIWNGTVTQKLDPTQKEKSFEQARKAVVKLLDRFPSKHR